MNKTKYHKNYKNQQVDKKNYLLKQKAKIIKNYKERKFIGK